MQTNRIQSRRPTTGGQIHSRRNDNLRRHAAAQSMSDTSELLLAQFRKHPTNTIKCCVVHMAKRCDDDTLSQRIDFVHAHSTGMLECAYEQIRLVLYKAVRDAGKIRSHRNDNHVLSRCLVVVARDDDNRAALGRRQVRKRNRDKDNVALLRHRSSLRRLEDCFRNPSRFVQRQSNHQHHRFAVQGPQPRQTYQQESAVSTPTCPQRRPQPRTDMLSGSYELRFPNY